MATEINAQSTQTVNVNEITSKINAACAGVERSLSKAQARVGAYINAAGQLVNKHDQLVEGLSASKIAMGQYVDELGNVRTSNDGFVADLNNIEQALGMYADSFGKVYTAQGKYVRETAKAAKAAEEQNKAIASASREMFEAGQRMREGFSQSFGALANASNQLGNLFSTFQGAGGALGDFADKFQQVSKVVSVGASMFQSATGFAKSFQESATAAKTFFGSVGKMSADAGKAVEGLGGNVAKLAPSFAALGGPIGIAVAGVAAVGAGLAYAYAQTSEAAYLNESFKELDKTAKKAGDSIKSIGDALHYGAFNLPLDEYREALKQTEEAAKAVETAREKVKEFEGAYGKYGGRALESSGGPVGTLVGFGTDLWERNTINKATAEEKNTWAEYAGVVSKMLEAAREEQKTEVDKLQEQLDAFEHMKTLSDKYDELKDDAEAQEVIDKKIESLKQKIADAKDAEERAAREAADKALQEARNAAGVGQYLERAAKAQKGLSASLEAYEETVESWREKQEELQLSEEDLKKAVDGYRDDVRARLAQETGVDLAGKEKDAADVLEKLTKARELDVISETEYADAVRQASEKALAEKLGLDLGRGRSEELTLAEKFLELSKASNVSEEARANALAQLQELNEKEIAEELKTISAAKSVADAQKERDAILQRLAEDLDAERVDAEKYKELRERALKEYAEVSEKFREQARGALEKAIGVDFNKTPTAQAGAGFTGYSGYVEELKKALADGSISQNEYNAALDQLKSNALSALPHLSKLDATLTATETAEQAHNRTLEEITKALEARLITEKQAKELRDKANEAEKKRKEQESQAELSKLGVDAFIKAGENIGKTQRDLLNEQFKQLEDAKKSNKEIAAKWGDIQKSYDKQLAAMDKAEKEKRAQEAAQRRESTRSKLGVDSLMEELKSPFQKLRETMDEIAKAAKEGAVTNDERLALESKAADDYWESMRSNVETTEKAAEKLGKVELGKSMSSGSEALYLAMVKNQTANYQTRIQNSTAQLVDTQSRALEQQQATNAWLEELVYSFGSAGVWG